MAFDAQPQQCTCSLLDLIGGEHPVVRELAFRTLNMPLLADECPDFQFILEQPHAFVGIIKLKLQAISALPFPFPGPMSDQMRRIDDILYDHLVRNDLLEDTRYKILQQPVWALTTRVEQTVPRAHDHGYSRRHDSLPLSPRSHPRAWSAQTQRGQPGLSSGHHTSQQHNHLHQAYPPTTSHGHAGTEQHHLSSRNRYHPEEREVERIFVTVLGRSRRDAVAAAPWGMPNRLDDLRSRMRAELDQLEVDNGRLPRSYVPPLNARTAVQNLIMQLTLETEEELVGRPFPGFQGSGEPSAPTDAHTTTTATAAAAGASDTAGVDQPALDFDKMCMFCTSDFLAPGQTASSHPGSEPKRTLRCGHAVGAICFAAYGRNQNCPLCQAAV